MQRMFVSVRSVLVVLCFLVSLAAFPAAVVAEEEDFADSAIGQEFVNLALKFLDNPGDFFFNLHADNEDYSPLPANRRGAIRFNFFPTFFPATWANINAKVKVFNDRGYMPQVDVVAMYGDLLALKALPADDVKPVFTDYSAGVILSKAADEKTRIFGGIKYTAVNMEVSFSTPVVSGDFEMSNLDFQISDTVFMTGLSHQTKPEQYVVAQIGYGFTYKKIVSRIMVSHRHLELGLDIYPEGLFVIHPFMAWHWFF